MAMKIINGKLRLIGGNLYVSGKQPETAINGLITQAGDYLITQNGDFLVWG